MLQRQAALAGIEGGKFVGGVADHGNAEGLENFDGAWKVEDGFCSRAHDGDRSASELGEIGGDVESVFAAAVRATDAPGSDDTNSRAGGDEHGSGDGGGSRAPGSENSRKIGTADLGDVAGFGEQRDLFTREADDDVSVEDADGRGSGSCFADRSLHLESGLEIVGTRKAVGDHGRLQGHHGTACNERGGDVVANGNQLIQTSPPSVTSGLTTNARQEKRAAADALRFDVQARCSTFRRDDKMPPQMRGGKQRGEEIIVLGDINADIIGRVDSWPEPGEECLAERVELLCGGVGANCALALRQWGISARLIGCVGKDDFGGALLKTLGENGMDVRSIQRTGKAMTGLLYINVTPDGQRTFFGSRGANCLVRPQSRRSTALKRAMAASFMGYSFLDPGPRAAAKQILRVVQARGGWVSLDVGMEPSQKIPEQILRVAKQMDLLFVSSEEAAALTGRRDPQESFARLRKVGARDVVMKLGKRGCLIIDGGVVRQVPSFAVRAVDSTGAGDAFTAAFLQARLRGWPVAEAAVAANAAGAAAASVVGAGENSRTLRQIARLLRTQRLKEPWDAVRLRALRRLSTALH